MVLSMHCAHAVIPSTDRMPLHNYSVSSNGTPFLSHIEDVLHKTTAALERRDIENDLLKKQLDELRSSHLLSSPVESRLSSPFSKHSNTSVVPIASATPQTMIPPAPNRFSATSMMPFTMSINNNLPSFSGKSNEMPTKFLTEFELRASGLFGYHDKYLLRAVQQQQKSLITTWSRFKQLFLQRFRTPDKVESFRARLRTLWQGDTESTADYFEKIKALISEIEPLHSTDYLKRKFFQKLRKDIREKMPVGLTSPLSDLLQKAIEIETHIIQQKIDDKLRTAQRNDQQDKHKGTTVNILSDAVQHNSLPSSSVDMDSSRDIYDHHLTSNGNQAFSDNKYSRTFVNSTSFPAHSKTPDASRSTRRLADRNPHEKSKSNNRWCSFCSSASHSWPYCYSNPDGRNYRSSHPRNGSQDSPHQSKSPPYSSENSRTPQPQYVPQQQGNLHESTHEYRPEQLRSPLISSSHITAERTNIPEKF